MTDKNASRPLRGHPDIRKTAVSQLAEQCSNWSSDIGISDWIDAFRTVNLHGNGFEIARDLDSYGRVYGIDADLVEILDGASMCIWDAHTAAVKAWVAKHDIKPTLSIGQRIRSPWGEIGAISGFVLNQACYLFIPDDERAKFERGGGIYVPYEDATILESATA